MLWWRCSNVVATSWQRRRAALSQHRKLTSAQLSFSTVPQPCDNVKNDVVTTLSQCRCASLEPSALKKSFNVPYPSYHNSNPNTYRTYNIWIWSRLSELLRSKTCKKRAALTIRYLLRFLGKITLYKTIFPSSLLSSFPQLFPNFQIVDLYSWFWKSIFHKIYDHQIWKAGTSRGIDSLETSETSNGDVVTLRSRDFEKKNVITPIQ